jgi:hypothetical protein
MSLNAMQLWQPSLLYLGIEFEHDGTQRMSSNEISQRRLVYEKIRNRMAGLNIQIERFIPFEVGIIDAWMDNPMGFHFQTAELEQFRQAVASNPSFGREHPLFEIRAGISHSNFAYREVGRADSLHIILRFNGRERSVIHLDSVSIAVGRDRVGQTIYVDDIADMIEHLRVDLLHRKCLFRCK